MAQCNDQIDQLLGGNVLGTSEFHKEQDVNRQRFEESFFFPITWQQL